MFMHRNMVGRLLAMMMSLVVISAAITPAIVEACEGGGEEEAATNLTELNFGQQKVKTSSSPKAVVYTAHSEIKVGTMSISGGETDFQQTNTCNGKTLKSGQTCKAEVTFTPPSEGAFFEHLIFPYEFVSSHLNDKLEVALHGEGIK